MSLQNQPKCVSLPKETLRLNYKMPPQKMRCGIIRVSLRSRSSSQNKYDLRRRWVFDSSGDLLVEESRGSVWTTSLRLQQWRGGEDGQTQAGHSPSLSYIQTARTRIVSPLAHISLAAGWKKQEQQSQQTVSWTVPLFPLKATFPTLLSSLPSRWCSACEKPVGFQMTRCKSVTRSRIWRAASSARYFCICLDSADHQARISAAYHTIS